MYKLTFENLRKFHQINLDGQYDRTPTSSEVDELIYMYHLSDALYVASVKHKFCNIKFILIATQIDKIPLAS